MKSHTKAWWLAGSAVACLAVIATAAAAAAASARSALEPVPQLDLDRYAGTWYEIAKYPNFFQRKCISDVQAVYARRADGMVDVVNSCMERNGAVNAVHGLARPDVMPPPMTSKLQVRFAPAWLSWLPFVWGRYWVVMLDPDYRYSVVSEPRRKYLWILSREPQLDAATYRKITLRLRELGLDPDKLVKTLQDGDR